jgi:HAMP domain-containing protein
VTRVAREVGSEGKLGGQAEVKDVSGVWKGPHRQRQLDGVQPHRPGPQHRRRWPRPIARGDLNRKITVDVRGEILQLKETMNTMVDQLNGFAAEVTRVAREVGTEGKLGGQAIVPGVAGTWKDLTDNVNSMAVEPHRPGRNIAEVSTAIARGDLSRKITVGRARAKSCS